MNSAFRGMVVSATYVPMKEPIVDRIRSHCDNTSIFQDKHTNQTFLVLQIFLLKAKISAMLSTGIRAGGVICEFCFNNATELAINLQSLHKQNGEPLDLSHIYNVDIWIDGALGPVLGQRVIRYQTLPKDVCRPCQYHLEAGGRLVWLAGKHLGKVLRRAKRPLDIPKGWCLLPQERKKAERNANELRRADHEVHDIADGRYDGRIKKYQQGLTR